MKRFLIILVMVSWCNVGVGAMLQHQKVLANILGDLPTIKSDTNNIIEHTNEVEEFLSKKPRFFMDLIKDNRFDIVPKLQTE